MAAPVERWFQGPWRVVSNEVLETQPKLAPGQILRHRSGAVVLNCPACNAMQFAHSPLVGPDDAPTLTKPVHCGAGLCRGCAVWFAVRNGHTEPAPAPVPERPEIPERLARAGVRRPQAEPGFGLPDIYAWLGKIAGRHVPGSDSEAALIQRFYQRKGPWAKDATEHAMDIVAARLGTGRPILAYLDALDDLVVAGNEQQPDKE